MGSGDGGGTEDGEGGAGAVRESWPGARRWIRDWGQMAQTTIQREQGDSAGEGEGGGRRCLGRRWPPGIGPSDPLLSCGPDSLRLFVSLVR